MPARIVLFGATGYTGRLVAHSLSTAGSRPVLAGRDGNRLRTLADELGGLDTRVADAAQPESVRALVGAGDVLVTTVGPFLDRGTAALEAAISTGATYLDSTAEPPFIRQVFTEAGRRALGRSSLVPAFGYDFVPGNLAGALALRDAGPDVTRIDVGYFVTGRGGIGGVSRGTLASIAGLVTRQGYAWRRGRMVAEHGARHVRSFDLRGRPRQAISFGGSEHYALPRVEPSLQEVNVYFGWFGNASRLVQAGAFLTGAASRLPAADAIVRTLASPLGRVTGVGPDAVTRAQSGSHVVALACDERARVLAEVQLAGPNMYTLTGDLLAWGARHAATHGLEGTGALGPVDAFGLETLVAGAAEVGLVRVPP